MPEGCLMSELVKELARIVHQNNKINNKSELTQIIQSHFSLRRDRSVYECADFAIRFNSSKANSTNFSNTVLSLSNLRKYDDKYFIVCVVTP
jgi:hypothetical protein